MTYIFGALSLLLIFIALTFSIQLIRIEKNLKEISTIVEEQVNNHFSV